MLSPPLTFILVLVALALEKVHACSYPNPYTSLASQSELPLCRRTLPESELREQCKGLCEATYPHLVILYEVGAHLMGECINECVSGESEHLHQLAAAAINAVRCKAWCKDRRQSHKLVGEACKQECTKNPIIIKLDELTRSQVAPPQGEEDVPEEFVLYCINTCDQYLYPTLQCMRNGIPSTEMRKEWEEQEKPKGNTGLKLSSKVVIQRIDYCKRFHRPLSSCVKSYFEYGRNSGPTEQVTGRPKKKKKTSHPAK